MMVKKEEGKDTAVQGDVLLGWVNRGKTAGPNGHSRCYKRICVDQLAGDFYRSLSPSPVPQ